MTGIHPLHSCNTSEHYTPRPYIEAVRHVLGRIDLDPASSAAANATVEADTYYTRENDGLSRPWFGHIYINPPGDRRGYLVKAFWRRACHHALYGGTDAAVLWAGYSLGPLPRLHACDPFEDGTPCPGPMHWPTVLIGPSAPCTTSGGRICWIDGETGEPGMQPGHGNYFCLLGGTPCMRARFRKRFKSYGTLIAPVRLPQVLQAPRNLQAEVLALLVDGVPRTKKALIREIAARKQDVLQAVNQLANEGRIVRVWGTRAWMLASHLSVPVPQEPRQSQEPQEPHESQEPQEPHESQEPQEPYESQETDR